jgi:hypothetical protein
MDKNTSAEVRLWATDTCDGDGSRLAKLPARVTDLCPLMAKGHVHCDHGHTMDCPDVADCPIW